MLKKRIKEIYDCYTEKILEIVEIFNNYYGIDRVDLQELPTLEEFEEYLNVDNNDKENSLLSINARHISGEFRSMFNESFILVHFPKVKVENEYGKFVIIEGLFAKIRLTYNGLILGTFQLNRSKYTLDQLCSDYMHSHIPGIPAYDFDRFLNPCLGMGPIRDTISNLCSTYDKDYWALFCLELDKYTQVESISGGPYRRLENINGGYTSKEYDVIRCGRSRLELPTYNTRINKILKDFYIYILNNINLKYNYINGSYTIGIDNSKFVISISNIFIAWYNNKYKNLEYTEPMQSLLENSVLVKRIYKNNNLYYKSTAFTRTYNDVLGYEGQYICDFKGKPQFLQIIDKDVKRDSPDNHVLVLHKRIITFIYMLFTVSANILYGNLYGTKTETEIESNKKIKIF